MSEGDVAERDGRSSDPEPEREARRAARAERRVRRRAAGREAPSRRRRRLLLEGGHLAVLSSLALAQPLFDLLGRNPEFFAVRGSPPREIVLFALALVLVPPAALVAVELLAELVHRVLRDALHLLFVAVLVALVAVQAANHALASTGAAVAAAAALVGAAAALAYRRVGAIRFAASLFVPVPAVLAALFLFNSPVSRLVLVDEPREARAQAPAPAATAPVLLVVFDELPTTSLLNRRGEIDAGRFPSFASLAADGTWYRDATTVSPHTHLAVPAILTGRRPRPGQLPVTTDHPDNLFTLLGDAYEQRVGESLTNLCPPDLCRDREEDSVARRTTSLGQDVAVVYLHLVAPDTLATRLPPVGDTWSDFFANRDAGDETEAEEGSEGSGLPVCGRGVCKFAARIGPSDRPALYFYHGILPHAPWLFLPSGRRYVHDVRLIPGTRGPAWGDDEWLIQQGYQRHLLQLGYADRGLGLVLERLRATGLYDETLVVVTADHGHSFQPGQPRRLLTAENLDALAFVPLIVKEPGRREGRVVDGFARTIDIVPTIADALGIPLPWEAEGRSLLAGPPPPDGDVVLLQDERTSESALLSELVARRDAALERKLAWFGDGGWDGVYEIGPNRELLGAAVATLPVVPSGARVELTGASVFRAVDPATGAIPSYVTGTVSGGSGRATDLAVALNGRIAAVTRTAADGAAFGALVPDEALVAGPNDVRVYAVERGEAGPTLAELEGLTLEFTIRDDADPPRIDVSEGDPIPIADGPLAGEVGVQLGPDVVTFRGWAADVDGGRAAERILVCVGGEAVFVGRTGNSDRRTFARRFGIPEAGFQAAVPRSLLPPPGGGGPPVRVFAIGDGAAVEIPYRAGSPWAGA